jgi:ATP-binding cassette subfamily F protein 3
LEQIGVHLPQGYLFQNISVQINKGDKIGLVGKNGAGKSTMLKIIAGWDKPSEGKIHLGKDTQVGFLTQDIKMDTDKTVFDYLNLSNETLTYIQNRTEEINHLLVSRTDYESESYLELLNELDTLNYQFQVLDGYTWEERINMTLKGLGFQDHDVHLPLKTFSGGWKMRAELAKILVNNPDVILLDEPTNHLDILSIAWLENYLQRFEGIVIVISHDRLFLDNVTKRTLEISMGKIFDYPYPYSKYKLVKEEETERLENAKKQQDKDIKHTEELINKFRAKKNKAAFAQSLIKKLDKTERIEVESNAVARMRITFPLSVQPGKWVLEMIDMGKKFGEKVLFKDINLTVGRGEKIALLGPNGVGKSTLLKRIMGTLEGDGKVNYGHNVNITYFAQTQAEELNPNLTIYETVDAIAVGDIRKELRSILGAFLFTGEDVDKKVGVLSGGERTRLALCQLLLSPSNFLILDEPTNHLDIQSKEVLKDALKQYEGTFIIVSHDREFLHDLTNRIWDIEDKTLKIHHFGVQEYLANKMQLDASNAKEQKIANKAKIEDKTEKQEDKLSYEQIKELKRKKNQLQNALKKVEEDITQLEKDIEVLDHELTHLDYSDEALAQSKLKKYEDLKALLDQKMIDWEQYTEELINFE